MTSPDAALAYAREHQPAALDDLMALLRIPSISTLSERKDDMLRAANWVAERLRTLGFARVEVLPTARHPVVAGEWMQAGPAAPTLLLYGHYDVQPTDPLELWTSDPFEPVIRGDDLFARGASDMKGQLIVHLRAIEALIRAGGLPVNMRFLIEGEEEIGSPSLEAFLRQNAERFTCDLCLNADSRILAPDIPALTYALRGLAYFEIRVRGPAGDLHSGSFGGAVENPAFALCRAIAGMRDEHNRVTLPGFYDAVRPLGEQERHDLAQLPTDERWWLEQTGAPLLDGEAGFSATERATARPTLEVNGLLSGFTGEGQKTVLPARAMAKVSTRLVADQTPAAVRDSLESYLRTALPPSVSWELEMLASARPAIVDRESAAVKAASRALVAVWGRPPLLERTGGTVPVVGMIQEILGADSLMLGFGLPDDNLHAPNEKQHLPNIYRGIEASIRFLCEYAG